MPITAGDLIEGRTPVWTTLDAPIDEAVALMVEHDYSQLPIVDEGKHPVGLITADSIVTAQSNLKASLSAISVKHARIAAAKAGFEDNLFDVFERFAKHPAVLVVNGSDELCGIVTPWDAAYRLRQRAEDLMLIEDIERAIKDYIRYTFRDSKTGVVNDSALNAAIMKMLDHREKNAKAARNGLKAYLGRAELKHKVQDDLVRSTFGDVIGPPPEEIRFEKLNLSQFVELLLEKSRWAVLGTTFNLDASNMRTLLEGVREIRNQLAHFRDEVTTAQRQRLRYCRDLFDQFPLPELVMAPDPVAESEDAITDEVEAPAEDELQPGESRYVRLALFLQARSRRETRITLTFDAVEKILESPLPPSAYEHRSWWANDSVSHVQSQQWLDAGWQVATVSLSDRRVTFARSAEREQMYIRFFNPIVKALRERDAFPLRNVRFGGNSWADLTWLPYNASRRPGALVWAFSRRSRFRVELYIDTGDQAETKQIFDELHRSRAEIERDLGHALEWERLPNRRACRVAWYTPGRIDDDAEALARLQDWAVESVIAFEHAIADRFVEAVTAVRGSD